MIEIVYFIDTRQRTAGRQAQKHARILLCHAVLLLPQQITLSQRSKACVLATCETYVRTKTDPNCLSTNLEWNALTQKTPNPLMPLIIIVTCTRCFEIANLTNETRLDRVTAHGASRQTFIDCETGPTHTCIRTTDWC